MRRDLQAGLDRLLGQQPGGQQHAGVAGVGAAGDGRDQHVAVAQAQRRDGRRLRVAGLQRGPVVGHLDEVARRAWRHRGRRAAGRTAGRGRNVDAQRQPLGRLVEAVVGRRRAEQLGEAPAHVADLDAVLRPLRPGQAGRDGAQVQPHDARVVDVLGQRHAVHLLGLEVGLEGGDLGLGAAGAAEVGDRLVVDREEAHRRAVLGRHVGDRRAVGQRQRARALAAELDELADHLLLAHNQP